MKTIRKDQGLGAEGIYQNTLCNIIMMDACYHIFIQIYTIYNTKNELKCKLQTLGDYDMTVQVHQL